MLKLVRYPKWYKGIITIEQSNVKIAEKKAFLKAVMHCIERSDPSLSQKQVQNKVKRLQQAKVLDHLHATTPLTKEGLARLSEKLQKDDVRAVMEGFSPNPEQLAKKIGHGMVMSLKGGNADKEYLGPRGKAVAKVAGAVALPAAKAAVVTTSFLALRATPLAPLANVLVSSVRAGISTNSRIQAIRKESPDMKLPDIGKKMLKDGSMLDIATTAACNMLGLKLMGIGIKKGYGILSGIGFASVAIAGEMKRNPGQSITKSINNALSNDGTYQKGWVKTIKNVLSSVSEELGASIQLNGYDAAVAVPNNKQKAEEPAKPQQQAEARKREMMQQSRRQFRQPGMGMMGA